MKFKIDENLPQEAAWALQQRGFEADTVLDEFLSGADDQTISDLVQKEGRILVTLDLDFANIRAYPPDQHAGIIVLRLKGQDKKTVLLYIGKMMAVLEHRKPAGQLWIVERDRIRIR